MMKRIGFFGVLMAVFVIGLILYTGDTSETIPDELANTSWQLVDMDGEPFSGTVTLRFSDAETATIEGRATCNNYSASVRRAASGGLFFRDIFNTLMDCLADDAMEHEDTYLQLFRQTRDYRVRGDTLILRLCDEVRARLITGPCVTGELRYERITDDE